MQVPPLTLQNVEIALANLSSGACVKEAEGALLSWQSQSPSPYAYLLLSATLSPKIRLAAILALKAAISKTWKDRGRNKRAQIFIDEATKQKVRYVLLQLVMTGENRMLLDESIPDEYKRQYDIHSVVSDRTVQSSLAGALVEIARLDLPKQFLDLVPTLVTYTLSTEAGNLNRRNAAFALEAILEMLSDKRLLGDKQYLASLAVAHCTVLVNCLVPAMNGSLPKSMMEEWHVLVAKDLHYLVQSSLPALLDSGGECALATDQLMSAVGEWSITAIRSISSGVYLSAVEHELGVEAWEMLVDVQVAHPVPFGRYIPPFLNLFSAALMLGINDVPGQDALADLQFYESRVAAPRQLSNEMLILALRFLSNAASCASYCPDATRKEVAALASTDRTVTTRITAKGDAHVSARDVVGVAYHVWNDFFTEDVAVKLATICMCHFMVASDDNLIDWADPEEYFLHGEEKSVEHDVRAAAESLYCALVESIRGTIVVSRLIECLQLHTFQLEAFRIECGVSAGVETGKSDVLAHFSVLLWESVYTAVGLAANVLNDTQSWPFIDWLHTVLLPSLEAGRAATTSCYLPLLRKRTIWILECYSSRLPRDAHVFVVLSTIVAERSSRMNDTAVKLSAVQAIASILNNFDEAAEDAIAHAETAIRAFYKFANECHTVEAQSIVLDSISSILLYFAGTGHTVQVGIVNAVVLPIPSIWTAASADRVLLKQNVVALLNTVSSCVGQAGVKALQSITLHIIDDALDPSKSQSFLVADTLKLWLVVLRLSPEYSSDLGRLFSRTVDLLAIDFEHLRLISLVSEMYMLVGGNSFLLEQASTLGSLLVAVITKVRPRGAVYIYTVTETLLREYPAEGANLLLQAGVMSAMLESCAAYCRAEKDCEPARVIALYLNALARVFIADPTILDGKLPMNFDYAHLIDLYLKTLSTDVSLADVFSRQLWLAFLVSLLPSLPSTGDCGLTNEVMLRLETVLQLCLDEFSKGTFPPSGVGHFRVEEDEEEETIITGAERYRSLLHSARSRDVLVGVRVVPSFKQRVIFMAQSPAHAERLKQMNVNLQNRLEEFVQNTI